MTQTVDPWSKRRHRSASQSTGIAMTTAQSQRRIASRRQTCMDGDAVQLPE